MRIAALIFLAALCGSAQASRYAGESCESARLDPQKGWVYTPIPCKEDPDEVKRGKVCGKDHGALRVGMTVKRFEQCNEALTLQTETVTAQGLTQTYRSTFHWIHVRDGKIVGYTRR